MTRSMRPGPKSPPPFPTRPYPVDDMVTPVDAVKFVFAAMLLVVLIVGAVFYPTSPEHAAKRYQDRVTVINKEGGRQ